MEIQSMLPQIYHQDQSYNIIENIAYLSVVFWKKTVGAVVIEPLIYGTGGGHLNGWMATTP